MSRDGNSGRRAGASSSAQGSGQQPAVRDTGCEVRVLADADAVALAAAEVVVEAAREAVRQRGRFLVALSGGSTPRRLYELLAAPGWATRLDWPCVEVFWSDERCVPPDHPDSNYGMTHSVLLSHVPVHQTNVHRMKGELEPQAAAEDYECTLRHLFGPQGRLDLVLLGMGPDGHTASLFPQTAALAETRRWCVANWVPQLGAWRLTLTYPAINTARLTLFLITGAEKAERVREVLAEHDPLPDRLPAALVRPRAGRLLWLMDEAAAGKLPVSAAAISFESDA